MDMTLTPLRHAAPPRGTAPRGRQVACTACALHPLCHPLSAAEGWLATAQTHRRLERGERLFRTGTPHTSIYAVRAGFLKVCAPNADGTRFILRFLLPGDTAGLDGFASGTHATDAVALEDSLVCEIPRHRAEVLAEGIPALGSELRRLLGRELALSQEHAALLTRHSAAERVERFLVDLSRRWGERGYSRTAFRLPMLRQEVGEHLGLTMETVSRVLSDFQARGWIVLSRGAVKVSGGALLEACREATQALPPASS